MIYLLSFIDIIDNFATQLLLTIERYGDTVALCLNHHALIAHPPNHIERLTHRPAKRQLQNVVSDPLADDLLHLVRHLKEAVGRAQPLDPLVRATEVVVFHPQAQTLTGIVEPFKRRPADELV
jgi:hypothetical protein